MIITTSPDVQPPKSDLVKSFARQETPEAGWTALTAAGVPVGFIPDGTVIDTTKKLG